METSRVQGGSSRMGRLVQCCLLAGLLVMAWGAAASAASVADGFESGTVGPLWRTHRLKSGGATVEREIVRSGVYALRLELHQGDMAGRGADGEATERAEIQEADGLWARFGESHEYAFSMYLPPDFPIVDTRLVIGQWKQACQDCSKNRSPIVAQRFRGGVFFVTVESSGGRTTIYQHRQPILGQWLDLRYRIRYGWSDGAVTMWVNGDRVAEYRGPLGYPDDPPDVYFKFGLYRDGLSQPMTIYFDDYRKELVNQE